MPASGSVTSILLYFSVSTRSSACDKTGNAGTPWLRERASSELHVSIICAIEIICI